MRRDILLLGDPRLYAVSEPVKEAELAEVLAAANDLRDTLYDFRTRYQAGRAIAAPQIGIFKRLIYLEVDQPVILINPELTFPDDVQMTLWDDCMSFPQLLVQVQRYKRCQVRYRDAHWRLCQQAWEGDLAELIQHEYDHLDGILATMRARDSRSFALKK